MRSFGIPWKQDRATAWKAASDTSNLTAPRPAGVVPEERFQGKRSLPFASVGEPVGRLSPLDLILCAMDGAQRPLDFALIVHLASLFSVEDLDLGARSARNLYAKSGCLRSGRDWVRAAQIEDAPQGREVFSEQAEVAAVEEFLARPFDPARHLPVRQLALFPSYGLRGAAKLGTSQAGQTILATRFHHGVADGLSSLLWLNHQLDVSSGLCSPVCETLPFRPLLLRSHPAPVRRSRFAFRGPSDQLLSSDRGHSSRRCWQTVQISTWEIRQKAARSDLRYSDLLAACTLEALRDWNHSRAPQRRHKIGLWLPVNIRKHSSVGFGNGASRIRIYARWSRQASFLEKCRQVRRQVRDCLRGGEWAVPDSLLARLPYLLAAPLLRCYMSRPWADMGTAVFTHLELPPKHESRIRKVEAIAQLHPRHKMVLTALSLGEWTWLTFTFDPAAVSPAEIARMEGHFLELIEQAREELP